MGILNLMWSDYNKMQIDEIDINTKTTTSYLKLIYNIYSRPKYYQPNVWSYAKPTI
jgi:hypothetical protein